jgi:uncharacterized protein YfaS (alpha-2-macroglobulin family)
MSTHDLGDVLRINAIFADDDGEPIDPTTVKADVTDPNGTETTYTYSVDAEFTQTAVGEYQLEIELDAAGPWYYRIYSTGTGQASEKGHVDVLRYRP